MSIITIVPRKGTALPVGECELVKETGDSYIVKAVTKSGRGRGVKLVLRQFVLPKSDVAYLYQEHEISAEEASKYPSSNGVKAGIKAVPAEKVVSATPGKRGRPKKTEAASAAPVVTTEKKRGPGRPKRTETASATPVVTTEKKRGPGRPKRTETATPDEAATPPADPPAKQSGDSLFNWS